MKTITVWKTDMRGAWGAFVEYLRNAEHVFFLDDEFDPTKVEFPNQQIADDAVGGWAIVREAWENAGGEF